jgi:hypothetical protein
MIKTSPTAAEPATRYPERIAVFLLCLLGVAHGFFFSAAFPFFSVVDEQMHFDLAVRYSQGDIPCSLTPPSAEALPFIAIYGTPEFLWPPGTQPGGRIPPPPWQQSMASVRQQLLAKEATYREHFKNHEAASPPLYYGWAGAWWLLGRQLGLDGGQLLYWLRFGNLPLLAALIWLGWRGAREVFPENIFIRLGVPALIAFLPQTAFYAINNDILTPLTFGAVFVLVLKFAAAEPPSPRLAAATGLALAAAYLTKTSNLPLLAAAGLFLAFTALRWGFTGNLRAVFFPLLLLFCVAALPMAAWMAWCSHNFGDWLGAGPKLQFLGWTPKPPAQWLPHPLFTGAGCWYFIQRNLASLWQGEMLWQRAPLALSGVDSAYVVLTLGALALALAAWLRRPTPFTTPQFRAVGLAFLCLLASFAFFALLSVKYDFHDCFYPSRAQPYFVSGRLLLGLLVPFLMLFVCGLDRLMNRFHSITKFAVLFALLAFMLASEISIDSPVFDCAYNWFHL